MWWWKDSEERGPKRAESLDGLNSIHNTGVVDGEEARYYYHYKVG